jgi:Protein of unknown function (DUF1552)
MDTRWLMSRRALLGGLGACGAAALWPAGRVRAAPAPRLLVVHVPEGMWSGAPRPKAGTTQLGPILEALQPWQSRILVLDNLNMQSRDHGPGGDGHHRGVVHMLTGTEQLDSANAGGASVDQKIAQKIGAGLPFASLQFAVRIVYGDTNSRPIWSGPGRVVPAMQSPWDAYKRVFANVPASTSAPAPAPAAKVDLRKSALDYALGEITGLRARLGARDRELLDSYHESLRDIERRLAGTQMPAPLASCAPPTLGSSVDVKAEANYPAIGRLQMDLAVAALQCGLTRVASLQWGNSNDQCSYSFLGINNLGHDLAHNNNDCDRDHAKKLKVFRWYSEQAAYLLGKLAAIDEGGVSMLDNTLVLWVSEFSESNGHSANRLMWLLMGNAGGQLRSGRVLDCGGRSVNDLHAALCNVFGITDRTFGNPAYCAGPLSGLT